MESQINGGKRRKVNVNNSKVHKFISDKVHKGHSHITFTYSKSTIEKLVKSSDGRRSGVFIVNFQHISHFLSSFSVVDFEQVIVRWVSVFKILLSYKSIANKDTSSWRTKSTMETLKQCVKNGESWQYKDTQTTAVRSLWCYYC